MKLLAASGWEERQGGLTQVRWEGSKEHARRA
jgi:hypothetical protein